MLFSREGPAEGGSGEGCNGCRPDDAVGEDERGGVIEGAEGGAEDDSG